MWTVSRKPLAPRAEPSTPNVGQQAVDSNKGSNIYNTSESGVSSSLLKKSALASDKSAKWGINWFSEPLQMPVLTLCGMALAIGHHWFYRGLDGNTVSDHSRVSQQAVKQAGNAFAFLAIASFKAATEEAYNQYIWTIFRDRPLKIGVLDKVFSLPFRITSFLSFQLLADAKVAFFLGGLSWLLFLGSLTPAATLSIVPASRPRTMPGGIPVPNYLNGSWAQSESLQTDETINPTAAMMKLATQTALDMAVIPPAAPALNSSYNVQFYGPTVQCNDSTDAQDLAFDHFLKGYAREVYTYTAATLNTTSDLPAGFLILSAFSPTIDLVGESYNTGRPNQYNNWRSEVLQLNQSSGTTQQLWIQTSTYSMVCSLVNASFSVEFEFNNGVGAVESQTVDIQPGTSNTTALLIGPDNTFLAETNATAFTNAAYYTYLVALGSNLFGNVSLENSTNNCNNPDCHEPLSLAKASSKVLESGLIACDEIAQNYWYTTYGSQDPNLNVTNFPSEPWMCRNRTLGRAIEDLANNITISALSSSNFSTNTTGPVTVFETQNVYSYEQRNLLISYGVAILVTVIAVLVGLLSVIKNGVYHSSSFSAIMVTTRNRDLDGLAEGACLGQTKDILAERLMFGVLTGTEQDQAERKPASSRDVEGGSERKHAAFGLEGSVMRLRKGVQCS